MIKIHFHVVTPFGLFWEVKYLNFGQKLPIRTAHQTLLESRHPEVTKNPYYVWSSNRNKKKVSPRGLIPQYRGVYIHYFKINPLIFCCPIFSENYLNPQVRINKMVNKDTVDYHPSPSSRIHPLVFLWTTKRFISPESLQREEYGVENFPKYTNVSVSSFDKSHYLCNF